MKKLVLTAAIVLGFTMGTYAEGLFQNNNNGGGLYGYGEAKETSQEGEGEQLHRCQTLVLKKQSQCQNCDLSTSPAIKGKLSAISWPCYLF